jgi:hypothetical protein
MKEMNKQSYKLRNGVNWYDESMGKPMHKQRHKYTKLYWNELEGIWSKSLSKKEYLSNSEVSVYNFKNYDFDKIIDDFGYKLKEKVALFLTRLYQRHIGYQEIMNWESVYWSHADLETYLGYNWKDVMEKLIDLDLISFEEKASIYDPTKYTRKFKLNETFFYSNTGYKVDCLRDEAYCNTILNHYKKTISKSNHILDNIEATIDRTDFIINNVDVLIGEMWHNKLREDSNDLNNQFLHRDDKKAIKNRQKDLNKSKSEYEAIIRRYYNYLCQIKASNDLLEKKSLYRLNESKFGGRLSHLFSNTPKLFRSCLTIEGEKLREIDIIASQPSFLFLLFKNWYKQQFKGNEKVEVPFLYQGLSEVVQMSDKRLDLYKIMASKIYGLNWKSKRPNGREEMKTLLYRLIFGKLYEEGGRLGNYDKQDLIVKIFGIDMLKFLKSLHTEELEIDVDQEHKRLSKLLHEQESGFMKLVMEDLIDNKVAFLPIYDSILVKESQYVKARDIFQNVIERHKLQKILKIN